MIRHFWHLSEAGENNLGLACTHDGLFLGRTPLVERLGARFAVRERSDIERLLRRAYRNDFAADRLMRGLSIVACALNANDQCLARIAAVHLQIPDLPSQAMRDAMEAEDSLIKNAERKETAAESTSDIRKASPDDPKHPGWPAGTPGGRGGKFRPKDGSRVETAQEIKIRLMRLTLRHALRLVLLSILRLGGEAAANFIPILDAIADAAMAFDIANIVSQYRKLATDAAAAVDFVNKGPHSLEELQVSSSGYEQFSTYGQFYKGEMNLEPVTKRFGSAGDGRQYNHIVTQGGLNSKNIPPEQLQNTDNVIILPTLLHEAVNAEYLKRSPVPGMNMYQWLQTQPYDVQREIGLKILRDLNIVK
jgi:hypothetical protein